MTKKIYLPIPDPVISVSPSLMVRQAIADQNFAPQRDKGSLTVAVLVQQRLDRLEEARQLNELFS